MPCYTKSKRTFYYCQSMILFVRKIQLKTMREFRTIKRYLKINYITAILSMTLVLTSTSCSKDDEISDTTKPTITITEPENDKEILIGDQNGMHLEMDLSDNVMLKSYKIEIHNNFDHHSHTSRSATTDFTFTNSYHRSENRKRHIHHHDVMVPDNATPGEYNLII